MSEGFITENDFLWYGVRTFDQNYLKKAQKKWKHYWINSINFAI